VRTASGASSSGSSGAKVILRRLQILDRSLDKAVHRGLVRERIRAQQLHQILQRHFAATADGDSADDTVQFRHGQLMSSIERERGQIGHWVLQQPRMLTKETSYH